MGTLTGAMGSDPLSKEDFLCMHDQHTDTDLDRLVCDCHC